MNKPLMAKATAVWLVDNTTLTFRQVAEFCGMHELEVQGIADGDVATGVKGFDPVANNQLDLIEIEKGQKDPLYRLRLKFNAAAVGEEKRRGPRYTPLSKRQDRPAAILWLVKFHPELSDGQIGKLVGTTKPTIQSIRERISDLVGVPWANSEHLQLLRYEEGQYYREHHDQTDRDQHGQNDRYQTYGNDCDQHGSD